VVNSTTPNQLVDFMLTNHPAFAMVLQELVNRYGVAMAVRALLKRSK
jgi:hypothetical protein